MNGVRQKPISLAVQLLLLNRLFPEGDGRIERSHLHWDIKIRPHPLAHEYLCRLIFRLGDYPHMYCLNPSLARLALGRKLPHVYSSEEPVEICLFMRRKECWRDGMFLGNVVIPLAFYWLVNFEEWLYSGHWLGGGTHEIEIAPPKSYPVFPGESPGDIKKNLPVSNFVSHAAAAQHTSNSF